MRAMRRSTVVFPPGHRVGRQSSWWHGVGFVSYRRGDVEGMESRFFFLFPFYLRGFRIGVACVPMLLWMRCVRCALRSDEAGGRVRVLSVITGLVRLSSPFLYEVTGREQHVRDGDVQICSALLLRSSGRGVESGQRRKRAPQDHGAPAGVSESCSKGYRVLSCR